MSSQRALVFTLTALSGLVAGLIPGSGWIPVAEAQLVAPSIPLSEDFEDDDVEPLRFECEPRPQLTRQGAIGGLQSLLIFPPEECHQDDWDEPTDVEPPPRTLTAAGSFDLSDLYLEEGAGFTLMLWANQPGVMVAAVRLRLEGGVTEISTALGPPPGAVVQSAWHPLPAVATALPIRLELEWTAAAGGLGGRLRLELRSLAGAPILAIDLHSSQHSIRKVDRIEIGVRSASGGSILGGLLLDDLAIFRQP